MQLIQLSSGRSSSFNVVACLSWPFNSPSYSASLSLPLPPLLLYSVYLPTKYIKFRECFAINAISPQSFQSVVARKTIYYCDEEDDDEVVKLAVAIYFYWT